MHPSPLEQGAAVATWPKNGPTLPTPAPAKGPSCLIAIIRTGSRRRAEQESPWLACSDEPRYRSLPYDRSSCPHDGVTQWSLSGRDRSFVRTRAIISPPIKDKSYMEKLQLWSQLIRLPVWPTSLRRRPRCPLPDSSWIQSIHDHVAHRRLKSFLFPDFKKSTRRTKQLRFFGSLSPPSTRVFPAGHRHQAGIKSNERPC